jgi:hypothetical protein
MKKTFFISYNKANRDWAEWIAYQLETVEGYSTISQAWDFQTGRNFAWEMHEALLVAEHTIAVLSPDYLDPKASFSQAEWTAVFKEDPLGNQRKLIPVRVEECTPRGLLGPIHYIDLVGLVDRSAAREKLLKEVSGQRRKPLDEPPFPGNRTPKP